MKLKVTQYQLEIEDTTEKNLAKVERTLEGLRERDELPDLFCLPEDFAMPHGANRSIVYGVEPRGEVRDRMAGWAREYGIYLSAGSISEKAANGKSVNVAYVFDRQGKELARYEKLHLFDIYFSNGGHFFESDSVNPGNEIVTFDTEFGRVGIAICFDVRFPELFQIMREEGAEIILLPSYFNMTTGPDHWETLVRSRALDNGVFMIATMESHVEGMKAAAYGHSMLVSPWGEILGELGDEEGLLHTTIELDEIKRVRRKLPIFEERRGDLYKLVRK